MTDAMGTTGIEFADLGPFYLGLARRSLDDLMKIGGTPTPPHITKDGIVEESPHYGHAVSCIVFSAVAVEHELMRWIAIRIMFQSGNDRHRRLLMGAWPRRPRIDDMLEFVGLATKIDPDLLSKVRTLFDDRNGIVHSSVKMERKDLVGEAADWEATVTMPKLTAGIVDMAKRDIQTAGYAIAALRAAVIDSDWRGPT